MSVTLLAPITIPQLPPATLPLVAGQPDPGGTKWCGL